MKKEIKIILIVLLMIIVLIIGYLDTYPAQINNIIKIQLLDDEI